MSEQYSKEIRSKATSDGNIELSIAKVEKPVPGDDEVLIEVQASPINPSDLGLLLSFAADVQNINVTAVKVSDDIGIATVYYSVIGQSINKSESSLENKVLKKFSGMVRSQLSRTMKIRRVPIINFRFDESIEYSENIEKLLQDL